MISRAAALHLAGLVIVGLMLAGCAAPPGVPSALIYSRIGDRWFLEFDPNRTEPPEQIPVQMLLEDGSRMDEVVFLAEQGYVESEWAVWVPRWPWRIERRGDRYRINFFKDQSFLLRPGFSANRFEVRTRIAPQQGDADIDAIWYVGTDRPVQYRW
jgi:hypothetical protein